MANLVPQIETSISYTVPRDSKIHQLEELNQEYFFQCVCESCAAVFRALKPGPRSDSDSTAEIIMRPSLSFPLVKNYVGHCWWCGAENGELSQCAGCKALKYCSRECQKADWGAVHKEHCKTLKAWKEADAALPSSQ